MKIRICLTAVICSLLCSMSAQAAILTNLDVTQNLSGDGTKTQITITGKSPDSYVPLAVLNPGADETSADPNGGNLMSIYQILKNIKTDTDGTFLYQYTVTNGNGEYTLKLGDDSPVVFNIMSEEDLKSFFDKICAETDNDNMAKLFSENAKEQNLSEFENNTMNKSALGAAIIADKDFADVKAAVDSYKKNAAALILSNSANKDNFPALSAQFEKILEIDKFEDFDLYKTFTDGKKTDLFMHISAAGVTDCKSFKDKAPEQIVLTQLGYTETYGEAEELLKKYPNIINIDWTDKLKGIKDPTAVFKGLKGKYYENTEKLAEAVELLAKEQKNAENKSNNNTTVSGGGTGGGGGSRTPATTVITPSKDDEPQKPQEVSFDDMKDAQWAEDAVRYLTEKKAVSGMGDNKFEPNSSVTREQFVKTAISAFGITDGEDPGFADADKSAWYYDSICIAYKNGIAMGIDENNFGIGKTLTREEMAVFAYRAAKKAGISFEKEAAYDFADNDKISDYAKEAVGIMSANGYIKGFPDGTFMPDGSCTRAQMAVVIAAILKSAGL